MSKINLCVIPARGGSRGILRKNIKRFCGKPLVLWTIERALESGIFKVVVSTDDSEIARLSRFHGAEVRDRPKELAKDNVHSVFAVLDTIEQIEKEYEINLVSMFLPTSPLRTKDDIINATNILKTSTKYDSIISVCQYEKPLTCLRTIKEEGLTAVFDTTGFETQRQDIKIPIYEVNGSIFISTAKHLKQTKSFHVGSVGAYIMSKNKSVDINTLDDWSLAEYVYKSNKLGAK